MKIIIDANIVFSCALNINSKIADIIFNSDKIFEFYSVYYLKEELNTHKNKLCALANLEEKEVDSILSKIYAKIKFIPEEIIPFEYWKNASLIVKDVDMNDIAFVTLSLFMQNTPIWTGDEVLKKGILAKGFDSFLSTKQVIEYRKESK
jgi:predicted nucleic acid-binding protein